MEIRHETSWYDKEQLPSMTSTQLDLFDGVQIQKVSGSPVTSKLNEHNIRNPRYEEGNIDVKNGRYDMNNQPKKATFNYEQEIRLCLGVAKIKSKNRTIAGKRRPFYYYSGEKIGTIDALKN